MTDISKDAVDALLQGVTAGPWQAVFDRQTWGWLEVDGPSFKIGAPTRATDLSLADEVQRKTDARFIAAARELVPALRAALDEAEARARYAETDAGYLRTQSEELRAYWNQAEARATHWQAGWQRAMCEFDAKCKEANEQRARAVKAEAERDAANALLREAREWLSCVEGYLRDGPQFLADAARIDAHLGDKP